MKYSALTGGAVLGTSMAVVSAGLSGTAAGETVGLPEARTWSDGVPDAVVDRVADRTGVDSELVAEFLRMDDGAQSDALAQVGLRIPTGLTLGDAGVPRFLMGQWIQSNEPESPQAAVLLLQSGLARPDEVPQLLRSLASDPSALRPDPGTDALVAADLGWSLEQTRERLDRQALVTLVRRQVRLMDPSAYVGIWINHESGVATLGLTAEPLPVVSEMFDAAGIDYELAVLPVSRAQLEEASEAVGATARAGGTSVAVSSDIETATLTVHVASHDDDEVDWRAVRRAAADVSDKLTVVVEHGQIVDVPQNDTNRGGVPFDPLGSTIGFVYWQHAATGTGVTSTAHEPTNGPGNYLGRCHYTFHTEVETAGMDASLYDNVDCGLNENEILITPPPHVVEIDGVVEHSEVETDDVVCHQGRTTGYDCGTVDDPVYNSPRFGSPAIRMELDYASSGGDSGGPVILSTNAVALHSGRLFDGAGNDLGATLSAVSLWADHFGLEILDK